MKNKQAKQMIESITPETKDYLGLGYINLPWLPNPGNWWGDVGLVSRAHNKDKAVLKKVKRVLPERGYNTLKQWLEDDYEFTSNYEITYDKKGEFVEKYDDGEIEFDYYVIQQTGYLGDDYSGTLWIPITNKRYLKLDYTC